MFFQILLFLWEFALDVLAVLRMTPDEKDLETLLLRQQLRIVARKQTRGPLIPRWQKIPLVALTIRLKHNASHAKATLLDSLCLFKPATIISWHRALVRRKWTFEQTNNPDAHPLINISKAGFYVWHTTTRRWVMTSWRVNCGRSGLM